MNFPPLPEALTRQLLEFVDTVEDLHMPLEFDTKLTKNKQYIRSLPYKRRPLSEEYYEWARKNILENIKEISVSISNPGPGVLSPHTDRMRDWVLLYIVDQGGPNASTTYWKEQGQPLIRKRNIEVNDYDTLELVDQCVLQQGNWYLLSTRVVHSVENIESRRIAIQLAIHDNDKIYTQLESIVGENLRLDDLRLR